MKKCTDVTRSGNVLYLEFLDSETNENTEEMFILKFDDTVIVYEDLEWVYSDEGKLPYNNSSGQGKRQRMEKTRCLRAS